MKLQSQTYTHNLSTGESFFHLCTKHLFYMRRLRTESNISMRNSKTRATRFAILKTNIHADAILGTTQHSLVPGVEMKQNSVSTVHAAYSKCRTRDSGQTTSITHPGQALSCSVSKIIGDRLSSLSLSPVTGRTKSRKCAISCTHLVEFRACRKPLHFMKTDCCSLFSQMHWGQWIEYQIHTFN